MIIKEATSATDKLKARIENNRDERERYQKRYEDLENRVREIGDAKARQYTSFWCNSCEADFMTVGHKVAVRQEHRLPIAWYVGYCPVKHRCIKRITDKVNDPYYLKSYIVRRDRVRYADDLLTPDDHRFWLLYGHLHGFNQYRTEESVAAGKPAHTY